MKRYILAFIVLLAVCSNIHTGPPPLHKLVDDYVVNVIGDSTAFWLVTADDTLWFTPAGLYWAVAEPLTPALLGYVVGVTSDIQTQLDADIVGDDVDSTSENFVFNDAYRITSAEADSAYMSKKYIDDAASGLIDQSVKGDHIDSTAENIVFDNAYEGTSAEADSQYSTHNWVQVEIEDSLNEYSLTSAIAATYQPLEATLTDIADGTIDENLVNTANPWADNEIASSANWNAAYNLFTDGGTNVYLTTTTDDIILGGTTQLNSGKFSIDGDADQIQLTVQANATQTTDIFVVEASDGTDIFEVQGAGELHATHTAEQDNDYLFLLSSDAAGFGGVKTVDVLYTTGDMAATEDGEAILVNFDENAATGGNLTALQVLTTTTGGAMVHAVTAGVGVAALLQEVGTFVNLTLAEKRGSGAYTDWVTAGNSTVTDVALWEANNDTVFVGFATTFEEIEWIWETVATKDLFLTFAYSTGAGTWSSFAPADGTNGATNNGVMAWERDDLAGWASAAVDGDAAYWVAIVRTRNTATEPTEDLVQVSNPTKYEWDVSGNIMVNSFQIEGTEDAYEQIITSVDPTADRTFTFPDDQMADLDLIIGDGAGTFGYVAMSGDATMTNGGVVTVGDVDTTGTDIAAALADRRDANADIDPDDIAGDAVDDDSLATGMIKRSSTTNIGVASFSSDNFGVSAGAVTIKSGGVDLAAEVTGTLPEANGGTGDTDLDDIAAGDGIDVTDGANTIVAGNATITVDVTDILGTGLTESSNNINHAAHTGDVTGATALTIAANIIDTSDIAHAPLGKLIRDTITAEGYITGNESITLSGDVGGSGATAITTTIQANAVESTMIGADQVNDLDINFGAGTDQVSSDDLPAHTGDVTGGTALTIAANAVESTMVGADQINDLDINFGSGTDQVSATDLPDFGTMTATDDNILVADGSDFESVAMSGPVTINNGVTAITLFDTSYIYLNVDSILQVDTVLISGDYITDFAGSNLSVTAGVLNASGGTWVWSDSSGEGRYWVDSATYASTAGAIDPFIPGKLTVTGPIDRYNFKLELDTANIYCAHADTFLNLPIDTNTSDPADTFQMLHPSVLYVPEGKFGYKYWFAGTPPQGGGTEENIHILVSNDEVTWTQFMTATDTLHNPVYTAADIDSCSFLSDPDIVTDENGDLFVIFRAVVTPVTDSPSVFHLYCGSTEDGLDWSAITHMLSGYYNDGTQVTPEFASIMLMSPSILMRGARDYIMYTIEDTVGSYPYSWVMWVAPRIDTAWTNALLDDTVVLGCGGLCNDSENVELSIVNWVIPNSENMWHADAIVYGTDQIVGLTSTHNTFYPHIYMGISVDGGESFSSISKPILDTINPQTAWDHDKLYRPSGYFIDYGTGVHLRMYYSAIDNNSDWHTGLTDIHFTHDWYIGADTTMFVDTDADTTMVIMDNDGGDVTMTIGPDQSLFIIEVDTIVHSGVRIGDFEGSNLSVTAGVLNAAGGTGAFDDIDGGDDTARYVAPNGDTALIVVSDDDGNSLISVGKEGDNSATTLRVKADTFDLGGDVISEFAGDGLTVTSNELTADLGGSVEYDEITQTTSINWANIVSDAQGTGSWVFSNSPTIVSLTVTTGITVPANSISDEELDENGTFTWTGTHDFSSALLDAADLGTDAVSADELNATGVEAELEAVLDLDELQGTISNTQIAASAVDGGNLGEIEDGTVDNDDMNGADDYTFTGRWDHGAGVVEIPNSESPTVDAEAEMAWYSVADELHVYDGSNDVAVATATKSRSFVIQDIDTDHDFAFWMTPEAITLVKVSGLCTEGTNVVGVLMEYDGDGANPAVCNSSDWTFTTGEEETASLSNATIDAGDYLGWKTTSVSGTVKFLTITFEYEIR